MTTLLFHSNIPSGFEISVDGQRYRFLGRRPHRRQDGTATELMAWESQCADCEEWFEAASPKNRGPEVRRCTDHRKPGKRASKRVHP